MARMDGALGPEAASALFDRFLTGDPRILLARAALLEDGYAGHGFIIRGDEGAELGFSLRRALWGRGLGHELAGLLIGEARALGLAMLWASVDVDNPASIRILEGAGFTRRRRVREDPVDYFLYGRGLEL